MKAEKSLIIYIIPFITACSAQAQGAFRNLDFEAATLVAIPGDPYGRVEFAPALPDWTGYVGGVQETSALYDGFFWDSSGIGILDQFSSFGGQIQGNSSVFLQAGLRLFSGQPADTTLSQTGFIPFGTKSLLFKAQPYFGSVSFAVTLGAQSLALLPLQTTSTFILYGADIHNLAGQSAQLSFTVFASNPHTIENSMALDDIQFSTQSVPEPGVPVLLAIG